MSRLDEAKAWYDAELGRLAAIHAWMRARTDVPGVLQPLVRDYYDKTNGPQRFKDAREEVQRAALVRLFSGFEADLRDALSAWLKSSLDRAHPASAAMRSAARIKETLPDSVKISVNLIEALEPRLSASDIGWFHNLRDYRNKVVHRGFPKEPVKEDPAQAHATLRRILTAL